MTCVNCTVASLLALFLFAGHPSRAAEDRGAVMSEFVGSSPCGPLPREFLGGMATTSACHCITWRLTLLTNQNSPAICKLAAVYGIPAPNNPNVTQDGPKVDLEGTWEIVKGAKSNSAATVYRINRKQSERSLSFVKVSDDLLHLLTQDGGLMVGNGGWSYTLNRADRAEKPGDKAQTTDMSYKISPLATGPAVFGVFEGRSPCRGISRSLNLPEKAGCLKVKWRVTLYQNAETSAPTTYKVEGSLHRQGPRQGTWSIIRGTKTDPNAIVYRLSATETEAALLLLQGDEDVLFFLDQHSQPLVGHADFSYTLNRVSNK